MSHEVLHLEIMSYDSTHFTRNFCLSCAWKDKRCRIGLILGTGTNACYLEDVKNIEYNFSFWYAPFTLYNHGINFA